MVGVVGGSGSCLDMAEGVLKRTRDKAYLLYVAGHPCLVCRRPAGAAHHIMFAMPRARGMKVGDEFTVPLCYLDHQGLHAYGNEREWWALKGIQPLMWAKEKHDEYRGNA